jgi:CRP-like cAMP-binding protein
MRKPWLRHLAAQPLFKGFGHRQLAFVDEHVTTVSVPGGRALCHEGDIGREMFLVSAGRVLVSRGGQMLTTLDAGDWFGEIAMLDPARRRTASVAAASGVSLFVIDRRATNAILDRFPTVAATLRVSARIRLETLRASADDEPVASRPLVVGAPASVALTGEVAR